MLCVAMERRHHPRFQLWLPVAVEDLKEGMAIAHDASQAGMAMVSASTLEVGASVQIVIRPPDGSPERTVKGRVLRVEKNTRDPRGLWPHRMAVEFSEPVPELEEILSSIEPPSVR